MLPTGLGIGTPGVFVPGRRRALKADFGHERGTTPPISAPHVAERLATVRGATTWGGYQAHCQVSLNFCEGFPLGDAPPFHGHALGAHWQCLRQGDVADDRCWFRLLACR
jgi:hypothetical protein